MSLVGGRPDVARRWPELLLLAKTGSRTRSSVGSISTSRLANFGRGEGYRWGAVSLASLLLTWWLFTADGGGRGRHQRILGMTFRLIWINGPGRDLSQLRAWRFVSQQASVNRTVRTKDRMVRHARSYCDRRCRPQPFCHPPHRRLASGGDAPDQHAFSPVIYKIFRIEMFQQGPKDLG